MSKSHASRSLYHLKRAIAESGKQALPQVKPYRFPLVEMSYGPEEILAACQVLLSGQLTMGPQVEAFEQQFAQYIGTKHAILVNSGSSANLLAVAASCDPAARKKLVRGDKVAIPAVAWSTSIWPWVQFGLEPVFVDVDPHTLNLDQDSLEKAYKANPFKALQLVHTLGNACDMAKVLAFARKHKILVFEDTCESLGSTFKSGYLGTFGEMGTFSFYFSHHITTIEGGMVITNSQETADILRTQRAHGWARQHSKYKKFIRDNPSVDSRFLFISTGFNLRPMEIQAAFGRCQLRKLAGMNVNRINNVHALQHKLRSIQNRLPEGQKQKLDLTFPIPTAQVKAAWFGFPFLLPESLSDKRLKISQLLQKFGVDSRPIISGNWIRQPALRDLTCHYPNGKYEGAEAVHQRGLYIGCYSNKMSNATINELAKILTRAILES